MHMADALLSPAVGVAFWAVSATTLAYCARGVQRSERDDLVPLMGVLGAFVFAAQMINFAIPGTGSSGHIGGGMLLSILLGPAAAFLVLASVLTVQALFFADGGLLALGSNLFNLGVMTCFVAYPLIFRPLMRGGLPSARRMGWAAFFACVLGLQLGSLGVVLETRLSGISSLPFGAFLWLMQPIHLAIGVAEGLATVALLQFIRQVRPDLLSPGPLAQPAASSRRLVLGLGGLALLMAGLLSWFASSQPDGLEWSLARATDQTELAKTESGLHANLSVWQERLALFPDYGLPTSTNAEPSGQLSAPGAPGVATEPAWPVVDAGKSLAGIVGGVVTLSLVMGLGYWLRRRRAQDL